MKRTTSSKEIVLGVTGSIAAYKACEIASRLVESGYAVTPALTASAQELVGPATFEALTGRRVITGMFDPLASPEIEHIAVAQRAALFLIAPATANIIAKAARGIADDWLSTTLLATQAPILFAPAMNTNMYNHPATQENIAILKSRGCAFVGPGAGRLACGTVGIGRMVYVPRILEAVEIALHETKDLAGLFVVLTAGGTREPVDPVRFIGNRSSGKMGRALAMEALKRARVWPSLRAYGRPAARGRRSDCRGNGPRHGRSGLEPGAGRRRSWARRRSAISVQPRDKHKAKRV